MGYPMMDMFVREIRAITEGPLQIIRLGSCGGLDKNVKVGDAIVQTGAIIITRNWDYFESSLDTKQVSEPYRISQPCFANQDLCNKVIIFFNIYLMCSYKMNYLKPFQM